MKKHQILVCIFTISMISIFSGCSSSKSNKSDKDYAISDNKSSINDNEVENVNYDSILGKWYCFESLKETFDFQKNGKAFYDWADIDESEEDKKEQQEEYEAMSEEEKKEEDQFRADISNYTYTLDGNKGTLKSKNTNYKFEFIKDGENTRLVIKDTENEEEQVDDGTWTYYKTWDTAKKNSPTYRYSLENIRDMADKDGWAIEDGVLLGYVGTKKTITIPSSVTCIDKSAFSWDLGRATKTNKITIGSNVKVIKSGSFSFCNADKIIIEEGVNEIEEFAFSDSYIKEIHFPKSITKIGNCIMQTEEGLDGCKIYCKKGSKIDEYMKENTPYGNVEIIYE